MRKQFLDRQLGAVELRAAAEAWRCTYLVSCQQIADRSPRADVRLEAIVWGFARRDGPRLLARVDSHLRPIGFTCALRDPDTIEVIGPATFVQYECDVTGWLRLLAVAELSGLCTCLRVAVVVPKQGSFPLVLFGVVRDGGLLFKAPWEGAAEEMFLKVQWHHQGALNAAINWYANNVHEVQQNQPDWKVATLSYAGGGNAVATDPMKIAWSTLARDKSISFSRGTHQVVGFFLWLWYDRPGRRSLPAFLAKLAIGAVILVFGAIGAIDAGDNAVLRAMLVALALLGGLLLARVVWNKARTIARYHAAMGKGLAKLYTAPSQHVPSDFPPEMLANDPMIAKFTADIEDIGGKHCYDFHIVSAGDSKHHSRLFLFPEHQTYFSVSFMPATRSFAIFPAKATFVLQTFFADGSRLFSTSSGHGYRKPQPELKVVARYWDGVTDVRDMLERHVKVLERLKREGRTPTLPPAESMVQRMQDQFEEARRLMQDGRSPFTWGDALHEGFGIIRREYREV